MTTLQSILDELSAPAELFEPEGATGAVRCLACAHRCLVRPAKRGICRVRFNQGGQLRLPWGYVSGLNADPVEKKPFYHFLPGATALTFGMLGCNFHCDFCQNWLTSQALRDPACDPAALYVRRSTPQAIVAAAQRAGAQIIASSYNEPLITAEWARAVFGLAVEQGLRCVMVSNGYASPEVLQYLRPCLAGMKVDLKCMNDHNYRRLGGVLENVLATIRQVLEMGLWLEVVTLVVPGFNDSTDELWQAARFLASLSPDIPWHVTAFHADYRMEAAPNTPAASLLRGAEIGREAGLRYVYAGNLPGRVDAYEHTCCPGCGARLVERRGFRVTAMRVSAGGCCLQCGARVAGVWG